MNPNKIYTKPVKVALFLAVAGFALGLSLSTASADDTAGVIAVHQSKLLSSQWVSRTGDTISSAAGQSFFDKREIERRFSKESNKLLSSRLVKGLPGKSERSNLVAHFGKRHTAKPHIYF